MKETKVYVDELPAQCLDCRFAYDGRCQAKENGESYCVENCRRSDCPLQSIKTHDRELVEEVCEKIKAKALGLWYFVPNEQKEYFEGNRCLLSLKDFSEILDRMQELEAEDEEN